MLRMKLPMRAAEEGEAEAENRGRCFQARRSAPGPVPHLSQEAVFEWFGWHLSPAQRIEFMCGLLHMCQPFELRFLGSCLEDLARKDFYVLRDAEVRANSQSDLGLLVDVGDPVVRSKLLVCLSLLSSGNRECAGILFRTLSHIYSALDLENGGASPAAHGNSGRHHGPGRAEAGSLEQLALLFTMASLHPAFPFHQREAVRSQLDNVEAAISEWRRRRQDCEHLPDNKCQTPDHQCQSTEASRARVPRPSRSARNEVVHIEKIALKEMSVSRSGREYNFEVKWSDNSVSAVTKTHLELVDFLLKLPTEHCSEPFGKGIVTLLSHGDQHDPRELERTLKEKFLSMPQDLRHMWPVCRFFQSEAASRPRCSRCNATAATKHFQSSKHLKDCSENSSLEEDLDLEPYGVPGAWRRHSSKGLGSQNSKVHPWENRRSVHTEHNGDSDWRSQSPRHALRPEECGLHPEQASSREKWTSGKKIKGRPSAADRERGRRGDGHNRISGSSAAPIKQEVVCKGSGRDVDASAETSSESSYSMSSSPRHLRHRSLQSEEEDEQCQENEGQSDNSTQDTRVTAPQPGDSFGGKAVAMVNPLSQEQHPPLAASPLAAPSSVCAAQNGPPGSIPPRPKPISSQTSETPPSILHQPPHPPVDSPKTHVFLHPSTPLPGHGSPDTGPGQTPAPQVPPPPQPNPQLSGCNSCGCRGNCHQTPSFVVSPQQLARQMFSAAAATAAPLPFLHIPTLCNATFSPNQGHQNNGGQPQLFYPPAAFAAAPLLPAHTDHVLAAQAGFGLPQMAAFSRFYAPMFPSVGVVPAAGGGMKKAGSLVSCYNCGLSGHYAHDCKQPPGDAGQPGNPAKR
ncbi:zinc finger CCHC domain-containing protein 2 isoform X2 [Denticeps clupeoides]|uniref:zinc finger CCHC domain-containing protein 2 isoform X2 n=1 Tax=Denticeps clupeoides TaxID=299321 RepID=UPI0010A2F738|nr:zinc finger CCHC domain-containing protein 2-like isoform X2 [Denticeps clupeoides]